MTRNKRFGMFGVANEINVSSSFNYTVDVWFWETVKGGGAVRKSYWYDPQFGLLSKSKNHHGREVPQYVLDALDEQLRIKWRAGWLRFFEYDRDGCKRYEDLRYHELAQFKAMIGLAE